MPQWLPVLDRPQAYLAKGSHDRRWVRLIEIKKRESSVVEDSTQEVLKFRLCFLVSDLYTLLYVLCFEELAKGKKMRTRYYIWALLFLATEATAQAMQLNIQVQSRPISVCKQKHGVSCLAALARAEGGSSSEIIAEQERGECVRKSVAAVVGSWIVDNFKRLVLPRATQD